MEPGSIWIWSHTYGVGWGGVMCPAKQRMKICQERDGASVSTRPQILRGNWAGTEPAQTKDLHTLEHGPSTLVEKLDVHLVNPIDWTQAAVTDHLFSVLLLSELRKTSNVTNPNKKEGNTENEDFQRAKESFRKAINYYPERMEEYIVSLK